MTKPVFIQAPAPIPVWADEATYNRRRAEAQVIMERFVGRAITPELQAEINMLIAPILRCWEMEDAGYVDVH